MAIAHIIAKKIAGTITPEEQRQLDEWLTSPDHRRLFKRLTTPSVFARYRAQRDQLEKEKERAWRQLAARLGEGSLSAKPRRRSLSQGLKWAAILVAVAAAAIWIYRWQGQPDTQPQVVETKIRPLQPGSTRAVLVLPDGDTVDLQAHEGAITMGGYAVSNEQGVLAYATQNNATPQQAEAPHQINVPTGGRYRVSLSDGTQVWLNATSSLMYYPSQFSGDTREVYLEGEAFFDVAPATRPFIVHTANREMAIKVLGTKFNVNAYRDEQHVVTTLVSGKVQVNTKAQQHPLTLKPGEQAVFTQTGEKKAVVPVDTTKYVAWKDGIFLFEDEPLDSIMRRLSRWYTFKTVIDNPQAARLRFTGVAYFDEPVEGILNNINQTTDIHITIQGNTIHLK